jgi:hypothetical protein
MMTTRLLTGLTGWTGSSQLAVRSLILLIQQIQLILSKNVPSRHRG